MPGNSARHGRNPRLTILVDRREQRPWTWAEPDIAVQPATLATGDYSLAGLEQECVIERKSLADWTHTVIHDAERWHRELQRLSALTTAVIVVEAGLPDVFAQHQRSAAAPRAILGRALSAQVDYQVPVFFAGDRPHARLWATAWLARTARRLHGKDIS